MRSLLSIALLLLVAAVARSAEIELRAQAAPASEIVTLGDVAQIHSDSKAETATLAQLELIPSPAAGRSRSLKLREIQDLLALQGVKIVDHRFVGATNVQIGVARDERVADATAPVAKVTRSVRDQLTGRVVRAISRHLQQAADDRVTWSVEIELTNEQLTALQGRGGDIVATGGEEPWTGEQHFQLQLRTTRGIERLDVVAVVSLPDMVVVARRPFRRGEVIRAADVELEMPAPGIETTALATRLEDVVGREIVRSIATGQPFESSWLRKPVLVRRGEIVTVFARGANLSVRTQARASEDGGADDVVTVERLDNKQRFTARVTGVQELEVLVGGVRVTGK